MQRNVILSGLHDSTTTLVVEHGSLLVLQLRQEIYEAEATISEVFFPLDSVLSIVARMEDGSEIEIGTIGREGMSAFPLLMGASSTANVCYCQVRGDAIMLPAAVFREITASDSILRQRLDRYLQAYVNMLGQLAACNRLHSIYARCARWLLMTRDRVDRVVGRARRLNVFVSVSRPMVERPQRLEERCSERTQPILDAGWDRRKHFPLDESVTEQIP
jgi:CRP-like cAMP-binding protein